MAVGQIIGHRSKDLLGGYFLVFSGIKHLGNPLRQAHG